MIRRFKINQICESIFISFLLPEPKWLWVLLALMSLGTLLLIFFMICKWGHFAWCQQGEDIPRPHPLYRVQ